VENQESKFKIYSFGIVAEHKVLNSKKVLVKPVELIPYFDGEVKSDVKLVRDEGVDKDNRPYLREVESDWCIETTWLGDTNRATAPDLRRGERVLIWRYDQENKFFWQSLGQDDGLRRLETVVWRFSDTTDEKVKELNDTNSWWIEMSTHKKSFTFQTTDSDGEAYTYGIRIDAKNGNVTIKDNLGNRFYMDSAATVIEMENADKSILSLNKTKALLKTTNSITMETKDFLVKAKSATIDASNITLKASTTAIKSKLVITGASATHNGKEIGELHTHKMSGAGPVN
jgi:hypothetical protein